MEGIFTVNGASHIRISGFNILHSGYAGVRVNGGGTSSDIIIEKIISMTYILRNLYGKCGSRNYL